MERLLHVMDVKNSARACCSSRLEDCEGFMSNFVNFEFVYSLYEFNVSSFVFVFNSFTIIILDVQS